MSDVVDLGASSLSPTTNAVIASCKGSSLDDSGDAPDYGNVTIACGLGIAARPAPADSDGSAQGFILDDVPGQQGVCVGAFDPRCADTYKRLGPGETAVFSTGKGYDSRLLCKDQAIALVVGDDTVVNVDRKNEKTSIACGGQLVEVSKENGILLRGGGCEIHLSGGTVAISGNVVLGGKTPVTPLLGGTPVTPVPAPGVFYGA